MGDLFDQGDARRDGDRRVFAFDLRLQSRLIVPEAVDVQLVGQPRVGKAVAILFDRDRIGDLSPEEFLILLRAELAFKFAARQIGDLHLIGVDIFDAVAVDDPSDTSADEILRRFQIALLHMHTAVIGHRFQCRDIGIFDQEFALDLQGGAVDIKTLHHLTSISTSSRGLKKRGQATVLEQPADTISLPSKKLPWAYLPNNP